jgi:mRNA-degrading endonuclease toxin of MazEF toxin-antitoxin module
MRKFNQYDIWYADFPFDGEDESKDRPVLIVKTDGKIRALSLMITSADVRDEHDMVIEQWQEAGLKLVSVIRTRKQYQLNENLFRKKIGTLQYPDRLRLMLKMTES